MNSQTKNSLISPQAAASELLRRRAARKSLLSFTEYTMPTFESSDHHSVICDALEEIERGECDRLIIEAPPRHTKSELASRRFPSWYLGKHPDKQIIATTYGDNFAADFGRDVRDIVKSPEYSNLFDVRLKQDSTAASRWHTDKRGVYIAAGVGGAITGYGAHIALIDDPFKNRVEADSELNRKKVWNWYTSTFYTRLMPGGAIIIILTRWHEDDIVGRLLAEEKTGGDKWKRIKLEAIENEDTPSERALWPAWYPLERLKQIKRVVGARDWGALYQQNPTPIEGTFFKRDWFNRFHLGKEPEYLNKYLSSDYAVTAEEDGQDPDFTEFGLIGLDPDLDMWALDWWYAQTTSDKWIEQQVEMIKEHKPACSFGEKGVIRRSIEPFLTKHSRKEKVYFRQEWIPRTKNKTAAAVPFQGMAASGKVHIPYGYWGDRLINQLCEFPAGAHDDGVDVLSLLGLAMDDQHAAIVPPAKRENTNKDAWGRPRREESSWRTK